ncbi:hypothetical protein OC834_003810 [Tilletia horrida]|uniref:Uncharacterized protein n=1 Tax=Tilletia horrida TaxID=155126 RepID=A0AAN6GE83_9BASI|nr:hypothetical protein OC835_004796 [Tilletia horrida]KAK0529136.1 hypothetical protein OC834_003810 [Tilletia horrida]KAK0536711.1 hypothetical protein OC842_001895 [Tilletia horrida]KAK0558857.1 hypothetical protein OC844_004837 [Tilletia horrida]
MSYTIAGRQVLNEHIALGTFAIIGGIAYAASSGGSKDKKAASSSTAASVREPAINASTSDEEAFIKQFLAEAEGKNERLV